MDEYATVMNRYTQIEVRNGFKEGYADLSLNFGFGDGGLLWLEDGVYCFDEEERGKVRRGGVFNSPSIDLTQKVMHELHGVNLAATHSGLRGLAYR